VTRRHPPGERRTVHPCWPEDSISRAKLRPGAFETGSGGGRPPKAWAYTTAGVAARLGVTPARARELLGDRIRDPLAVAAAIVASTASAGLSRAEFDRVLDLLRTRLDAWPLDLRRRARAPGRSRAEVAAELLTHYREQPPTSAELARLLELDARQLQRARLVFAGRLEVVGPEQLTALLHVTSAQARAMWRTLQWRRAGSTTRQPLGLADLTPAERRAAVEAVSTLRARVAREERSRASARAAHNARRRTRGR
jgi:hypothetical protein